MRAEKSAGIILFRNKEGKREYLLLKYESSHEYWGLCKGRIEKDESPEQAALRECEEETDLQRVKLLPDFREESNYFFKREGELTHKEVIWFCAEVTDDHDGKVSEEHQELGWFSYADAVLKMTYKKDKEVLIKVEEYLNRSRS
ncbi:diadenosine tetraphosphate hydrolase [Candidatus Woesearchaeota archaeon CG10_big_fil_rev_8_21_14_0_10_45_16]|nr:MAG: diadenosine tetraphosphate hydrolase [Candidatus Woesearchaeota archaeon CG10_big_fil_rev_8_21_14_0_10_45_16]